VKAARSTVRRDMEGESHDKPVPAREPAWMPASVGSAYRRGTRTEEDLVSGGALTDLVEGITNAGTVIRSAASPKGAVDQASGFRHLLVLLALGADEALRHSDPYDPYFAPANVDAVLKWGMDCPDAAYTGAAIRGDATYLIRGNRRTVRYLGFQVMSGIASTANVVADDLKIDLDGSFELVLSSDPPEEAEQLNWMPLTPETTSLVVRQFFYDWDTERAADLEITCLGGGRERDAEGPLSAAGIGRQLAALGEFVEASFRFWSEVEEAGRIQGLNIFREPAALTQMGAAAENVSVWGSWQLDEEQALLIEVEPPPALYWSISLGNHWWETIDYANHQSSLNGFQAAIDPDGVFRAIVSRRDPGVANWLDTAGHGQGPMIVRWLRAGSHPVPDTTVLAFESIREHLPALTALVTPEDRRRVIDRRRAGVRRRFRR
jgi:hypothetical protein